MKNTRQILLRFLWAGVLVLANQLGAPAPAHAQQVPDRLNYQGMLRKGDGTPEPAGYKDIEFRIYDAPTAGTLQWARTHRVNLDTNGLFNVVLMEGGSPISQGSPLYTNLVPVFTAPDSQDRYLELTVAGFNPIQPRQRFVAAAYAFLAADVSQARNLTVMGNLTVQNSARAESLTVDTTTTLNTATILGDVVVGSGSTDCQYLGLGGGSSWGYLYGSDKLLGDGIHLGYNYYADASGTGHVHNLQGQTSRLTLGNGKILLATAGSNTAPIDRMIVDQQGRVGIGTSAPGLALQVGDRNVEGSQGMIRLGSKFEGYNRSWDIGVPQTGTNTAGKAYSFVIDDTQDDTGPEFLIRYDTHNVGIGTTNPVAKLDVHGDIKIKSQAPIVIRRYPLPDLSNQPSNESYTYVPPTSFSTDTWSAAVVGVTSSGDWSYETVGPLLNISMQKSHTLGKWVLQFDVRHHSTLNNITVDVMYIRKELVDDDR